MTWEQAGRDVRRRHPHQGPVPQGLPAAAAPQPRRRAAWSSPRRRSSNCARLERFDLDFDLPEHFLPEFPPAIFLTTRPDLGDVSQGKVVTLENFQELFQGILNAKDLEGMRLLVTQFPQQQFNATADRKTEKPEHAGRGLLRLPRQRPHVRGDPPGGRHPAAVAPPPHRDPQPARRQHPAAVRLAAGPEKSIEDFTEFEQRAAYFDGDPVSATAKGINPLDRGSQVHFMAEVQDLLDFPPAPGLGLDGKLDPKKFAADSPEMRGQKLFFGKAQCATCHPAPYYTDNSMHNLKVERFYQAADDQRPGGDGTGADQDVPAARHQGIAAVLARWPAADARGHGRVLQPGPRAQAVREREGRPRRLHAAALRRRRNSKHQYDGAASLLAHARAQLFHVRIRVGAVGLCQCRDSGSGRPAFASLDASELALGQSIDLRLQDPCRLAGPRIAAPYRRLKPALRCWALRSSSGSTACRNWFQPRCTSRSGQ